MHQIFVYHQDPPLLAIFISKLGETARKIAPATTIFAATEISSLEAIFMTTRSTCNGSLSDLVLVYWNKGAPNVRAFITKLKKSEVPYRIVSGSSVGEPEYSGEDDELVLNTPNDPIDPEVLGNLLDSTFGRSDDSGNSAK